MTTLLQVQANHRNALKSTGPRSRHGKAMSRRNSVKHGVINWTPVLLPGESSAAWEKFARLVVFPGKTSLKLGSFCNFS
jgi:hypothetical protein